MVHRRIRIQVIPIHFLKKPLTLQHANNLTLFVGGRGNGGINDDLFTDVVYKKAESNDNIKFNTSDDCKCDLDAKFKSRDNEMEVFNCDPCSKSKTRKDKIDRVLATSFAMYLIFLLSKPVFNSDTSHEFSMSIRDEI